MRDYTREELLALTPARYLADGLMAGNGQPKPELQTDYATAASTQLLAAELSPQELGYTYEALRQVLALPGVAAGRFEKAVAEALEIVGRMIKQSNNRGLTQWINECAAHVRTPADIKAFMSHFLAVLQQYTLIVALPRP